jgi:hypothetical protein
VCLQTKKKDKPFPRKFYAPERVFNIVVIAFFGVFQVLPASVLPFPTTGAAPKLRSAQER